MLLMLACAVLGCGQRLGRCLDLEALVTLAPICREQRALCRLGVSTACLITSCMIAFKWEEPRCCCQYKRWRSDSCSRWPRVVVVRCWKGKQDYERENWWWASFLCRALRISVARVLPTFACWARGTDLQVLGCSSPMEQWCWVWDKNSGFARTFLSHFNVFTSLHRLQGPMLRWLTRSFFDSPVLTERFLERSLPQHLHKQRSFSGTPYVRTILAADVENWKNYKLIWLMLIKTLIKHL